MSNISRNQQRNLLWPHWPVISIFGRTHFVLEGRAQHLKCTPDSKVQVQYAHSVHQEYFMHTLHTIINHNGILFRVEAQKVCTRILSTQFVASTWIEKHTIQQQGQRALKPLVVVCLYVDGRRAIS
jgi:hypothetical protein